MKRILIVISLIAVACDATVTTTTTTPPTTTVKSITTTTAGQQLVDGGLVPIDSPTLIPLEGAEPVTVGISHSGVVSPSGEWVAVISELGSGSVGSRLSIINVPLLQVIAAADVAPSKVIVNDEGRAFFFVGTSLTTLGTDGVLAAVDAPDSPVFLQDSLADLGEGQIGYLTAAESERSNVDVVVATDSGTLNVFDVARAAGPGVIDDRIPDRANVVPTVAWADSAAHVISAEANAMTSVDLISGDQSETEFVGADEPFEIPVQRSVWAAPSGLLFIATSTLEVSETDETWTATESPQPLVVVDLSDGSSSTRDVTLSLLYPSRDGSGSLPLGTPQGRTRQHRARSS